MDSALLQFPFAPGKSTLSRLALFSDGRVDDLLPHRPSNVCLPCWKVLFSKHLGLPCVSPSSEKLHPRWPKVISYATSLARMRSRAIAGCMWCQLLLPRAWHRKSLRSSWNPASSSKITVQGFVDDAGRGFAIHDYQGLHVEMDGSPIFDGFVYTAPGACRHVTTG